MRFLSFLLFICSFASNLLHNGEHSSSSESDFPAFPRLETLVFEAYPWETLDARCSISCNSRVKAIGILGLILFKFRNSCIRALGSILDVSVAKGNVHFNSIMNEPFLKFFVSTHESGTDILEDAFPKHFQKSVYDALTVKRSGQVKLLLYQLLSRSEPPVCISLQLAVKLALMKSIGKNVQQAIQQGRVPRRKNSLLTSESISQVLIVPELEQCIQPHYIKSFFQVANLASFEYLQEYFGLFSEKTAKLLLENTRPVMTQAHLQFLSSLPLLSPKKQKMLSKYKTVYSDFTSYKLMLLDVRRDRFRMPLDYIFINLCPGVTLTPIHVSSLDTPHRMMQVTINQSGKLEMTLPKRSRPASLLYFQHERNNFISLTGMVDPEIRVSNRDLIIVSMQPGISILLMTFIRRFFKERGVHDPLFMYFVHKHKLTLMLIQANQ